MSNAVRVYKYKDISFQLSSTKPPVLKFSAESSSKWHPYHLENVALKEPNMKVLQKEPSKRFNLVSNLPPGDCFLAQIY